MKIDERVITNARGGYIKKSCKKKGHKTYPVSLRLPKNSSPRRLPFVFCNKCEKFFRVKGKLK